MITVGSLKEELALLKKTCDHGQYVYNNSSGKFTICTTTHFRQVKRQERYGVYVVRQQDTREILYIGKAGTIDSQGRFKSQDVPGRLKNVKEGNISANRWFLDLVQEKGPIIIEYIFLSKSTSPSLVEALLLQAHLNERHRLPYKNKSL